MKVIKKIVNQIWEELEGAENYIECAMKYKEEYPTIANMYYEISIAEMTHYEKLHSAAISLINEMRAKGTEIESDMLTIYNYEHDKAIEKATHIKVMQEMYKR